MAEAFTSRTVYQTEAATPIGQIHLAGIINKGGSRIFENMRVFGKYALVYLLDGQGVYLDANQYRRNVRAGDLLILFPELAHSYGPLRGDPWVEFLSSSTALSSTSGANAACFPPKPQSARSRRWTNGARGSYPSSPPSARAKRMRLAAKWISAGFWPWSPKRRT